VRAARETKDWLPEGPEAKGSTEDRGQEALWPIQSQKQKSRAIALFTLARLTGLVRKGWAQRNGHQIRLLDFFLTQERGKIKESRARRLPR
jgi:hypothetical protein